MQRSLRWLHNLQFLRSFLLCALGFGFAASCSSPAPATPSSGDGGSEAAVTGAEAGPTTDAATANDSGMPTTHEAGAVGSDGGTTPNDGPSHCAGQNLADGGTCPAHPPATTTIIGATYSAMGSSITYGTGPDAWDVYTFAGPGENAPTATPSASTLTISATLSPSASGPGWAGVGTSVAGPNCIDASNYGGISFTVSGDLGGCSLYIYAITGQDQSNASDPCRGACVGTGCNAPGVSIPQLGMTAEPFFSFRGGKPNDPADTRQLIGLQWRLQTSEAEAGAGCRANITISNVQFVP